MTYNIEGILLAQLYSFLIVFCRIGTALMLMPGFGELFIPTRVRMGIALGASMVLAPIVSSTLPAVPNSIVSMMLIIGTEALIGLFMGLVARIILSTMHIVGIILSMQSSLGSAMQFDPSQGTQGSGFGNYMSILAVTMFFALDLHHLMLAGLADSYSLFIPGKSLPMQDFAIYLAKLTSGIFDMAIKLSAPQIIIGLMLYFISGVLSRLMPQMQVFFVIMPIQIMGAFFIMAATLSAVMLTYMDYVETTLTAFLKP